MYAGRGATSGPLLHSAFGPLARTSIRHRASPPRGSSSSRSSSFVSSSSVVSSSSSQLQPAPASSSQLQTDSMDITVRVEVQYVAPARARVRDVLHMFRTPAWVRFMVRYISPHLKNAAPADKSVLDSLPSWRVDGGDAGCQCVICMSELAPRERAAAVRLPCGHAFHQPCIRSWLERRSTCPSCRFQFRKAFAGSYAVRTLNSALLLKPEHRALRRDAVLGERVGGDTVRAVVHVTLSPVPQEARQQQYPCVLNALMMHANGDHFQDAPVDKADADAAAPAGPSAGTRSRARRASDLEGFAREDGGAKRLRVA